MQTFRFTSHTQKYKHTCLTSISHLYLLLTPTRNIGFSDSQIAETDEDLILDTCPGLFRREYLLLKTEKDYYEPVSRDLLLRDQL